jgi:hypothetical protein
VVEESLPVRLLTLHAWSAKLIPSPSSGRAGRRNCGRDCESNLCSSSVGFLIAYTVGASIVSSNLTHTSRLYMVVVSDQK